MPDFSSKLMERGVPAVARAYVRAKVLSFPSCYIDILKSAPGNKREFIIGIEAID